MYYCNLKCTDGTLTVVVQANCKRLQDDYEVLVRCLGYNKGLSVEYNIERIRRLFVTWPEHESVKLLFNANSARYFTNGAPKPKRPPFSTGIYFKEESSND